MQRVAVVLVLICLCATPVVAQAPDAPHVSPEDNTLFAHRSTASSDESVGWLSTLIDDPAADDTAMGASANAITARTWTLTMDPAIEYSTVLKGNAEVFAYIGSSAGRGAFQVTTELRVGSTVLATGAAQNLVAEPAGTGNYALLRWTLAVDTTLEPGAALVWFIEAEGAGQTIFLGVAEDRGRSRLTLPVESVAFPEDPPGEPAKAYENITSQEGQVNVTQAEPSDVVYVYNWTAASGNVSLSYVAAVQAGTAAVTILDAANTTVWSRTLSDSSQGAEALQGAAGLWRIEVRTTGFEGAVNITLTPEVEPGEPGTTTTTSGTGGGASSTSASQTDTGTTETSGAPRGEDSPAAPLIALLAILGVAAIAARRRT